MNRTQPKLQPSLEEDLDRKIDRTLHALGHVDASGLDDHILAALEAHTTGLRHPKISRSFFAALQQSIVAAASLALLLFSLAVLRAHHRVLPPTNSHLTTSNSHLTTSSLAAQHQPLTTSPSLPTTPTTPGAPSSPAADRGPQEAAVASWGGSSPVTMGSLSAKPTVITPFHFELTLGDPQPHALTPDQQALADLHAPSFPAPPLPPTPQERLVRLMLRRGEVHDLAQLDPAQTAAFALQDQIAFGAFFDPPVPRLAPVDPTTGPNAPSQPQIAPHSQGDPQ